LVTIRVTVVWDLHRTTRHHTSKPVHVEHVVNKTSLGRVSLTDYTWVRDLTDPMHLGLSNRPFVFHVKSWEP